MGTGFLAVLGSRSLTQQGILAVDLRSENSDYTLVKVIKNDVSH